MKKFIILSIVSILLLTSCGENMTETMSCTHENETDNLTAKIKYDIDYQDKTVKKVRITYDYVQKNNDNDSEPKNTDGIDTGTDGTTEDTQPDDDGIIDGIVGSAIDQIVGDVTDTIIDIAGLKDRHSTVQNNYNNINGFSVQNTTDTDNNYKVTYVIDYDVISDDDLKTLNLSRDIDVLRDNYISQGFSCSK